MHIFLNCAPKTVRLEFGEFTAARASFETQRWRFLFPKIFSENLMVYRNGFRFHLANLYCSCPWSKLNCRLFEAYQITERISLRVLQSVLQASSLLPLTKREAFNSLQHHVTIKVKPQTHYYFLLRQLGYLLSPWQPLFHLIRRIIFKLSKTKVPFPSDFVKLDCQFKMFS